MKQNQVPVLPLFRYSLRDVFWLTLVVAMACAWGVDRWQLTGKLRRLSGECGQIAWNYTWTCIKLQSLGYVVETQEGSIPDIQRQPSP